MPVCKTWVGCGFGAAPVGLGWAAWAEAEGVADGAADVDGAADALSATGGGVATLGRAVGFGSPLTFAGTGAAVSLAMPIATTTAASAMPAPVMSMRCEPACVSRVGWVAERAGADEPRFPPSGRG
jgi:hypothetical protein